jgi:hypothetical protein
VGCIVTFRLSLLAAFMREVILVRFSVSCFARWGFIGMSSAIVSCGMGVDDRAGWKVHDVRYFGISGGMVVHYSLSESRVHVHSIYSLVLLFGISSHALV